MMKNQIEEVKKEIEEEQDKLRRIEIRGGLWTKKDKPSINKNIGRLKAKLSLLQELEPLVLDKKEV